MITIRESKTADTRSAEELVDEQSLLESSIQHIEDIRKAMDFFQKMLHQKGQRHDITKLSKIKLFHKDFAEAQNGKKDFTNGEWYQLHIRQERHHLNNHCPEDVNLLDVLEMVADGVMAGMARTGNFYPFNIAPEILNKAVENTATLLKKQIKVEK